jgi:hypothetical protein
VEPPAEAAPPEPGIARPGPTTPNRFPDRPPGR